MAYQWHRSWVVVLCLAVGAVGGAVGVAGAQDQPSRVQVEELAKPALEAPLEPLTTPEEPPPTPALEPVAPPAEAVQPQPAAGAHLVILDAGHGGRDGGCRGAKLVEKDLTLALVRQVQRLLQQRLNAAVLVTRSEDIGLSVENRKNFARLRRGDLFVSIHVGAGFAAAAHGFELFCPPRSKQPASSTTTDSTAESRRIAEAVAEQLTQSLGPGSRGVHEADCRILKGLTMPCVLLEVGCLTNPGEEELLGTAAYQAKMAQGIVEGLRPFVAGADTGSVSP